MQVYEGVGLYYSGHRLNMTFQMCKYVALCEEVGLSPESQPAVRSHPKQSNPYVFNNPRNYVPEPRTPV
jgi:hypothetical protein